MCFEAPKKWYFINVVCTKTFRDEIATNIFIGEYLNTHYSEIRQIFITKNIPLSSSLFLQNQNSTKLKRILQNDVQFAILVPVAYHDGINSG